MTGATHSAAALLRTFAASRRGLRLGTLFGAPAVFVGRRTAIRLDGHCIALRLTPAAHDLARALCGRVRGAQPSGWTLLDIPRDAALPAAYVTLFERAVRDTALESATGGAGTAA